MPVPLAAKAGIIAVSMGVAAAIAIYESPEVRRRADELRRRIAIALQTLGENIAPNENGAEQTREPMFNRPEDAEGFMMSRGGARGETGDVVADEESRRRQREELLYWNRVRLERDQAMEEQEKREAIAAVEQATREAAAAAGLSTSGLPMTSFDQLLQPDGGDRSTFVVNTGAEYANGSTHDDTLNGSFMRRRRAEGVRGLNASVYTNPFSDEYGIDMDEQHDVTPADRSLRASALSQGAYIGPEVDELMSDIYNASAPATPTLGRATPAAVPLGSSEVLFDATHTADATETTPAVAAAEPAQTLEHALAENEFNTAGQSRASDVDAYNSIQAWANTSSFASDGFYSPLPVSPVTAPSEPDIISTGELTPTDSLSVVDATEHSAENAAAAPVTMEVAAVPVHDAASPRSATVGRDFDVMSVSEDGTSMLTPTSWSEVGSVLSESDAGRSRAA